MYVCICRILSTDIFFKKEFSKKLFSYSTVAKTCHVQCFRYSPHLIISHVEFVFGFLVTEKNLKVKYLIIFFCIPI